MYRLDDQRATTATVATMHHQIKPWKWQAFRGYVQVLKYFLHNIKLHAVYGGVIAA